MMRLPNNITLGQQRDVSYSFEALLPLGRAGYSSFHYRLVDGQAIEKGDGDDWIYLGYYYTRISMKRQCVFWDSEVHPPMLSHRFREKAKKAAHLRLSILKMEQMSGLFRVLIYSQHS